MTLEEPVASGDIGFPTGRNLNYHSQASAVVPWPQCRAKPPSFQLQFVFFARSKSRHAILENGHYLIDDKGCPKPAQAAGLSLRQTLY